MSYDLAALGIIVLVMSPRAAELSVVTAVLVCGCPIYSNMTLTGAAALKL